MRKAIEDGMMVTDAFAKFGVLEAMDEKQKAFQINREDNVAKKNFH